MKIISFCLWGNDPKYTVGAIKNAELAKSIYPDWTCRFYVANDVPNMIIFNLEIFDNVEVVNMNKSGDWTSMFWRFLPAGEPDVDVMISRDTDSRLNYREKAAVDEWLESDKVFHIMRDHPSHKFPVLGGMWGAKKNAVPMMKEMIEDFGGTNEYGTDYVFFADKVLPTLNKEDIMVHDEFYDMEPFPIIRKGFEFVGEVYDENDNNTPEHTEILKKFLNKTIYIHHHLGLGDHIDCNGMIRYILKNTRYEKVCVFTKEKYYSLIEYMYRDDSRIQLVKISNDNEHDDVINYSEKNKAEILQVGHQYYPWGQEEKLGKGCAELFYDQVGIPYDVRFEYFYYDRDELQEERLCKKLNPLSKPYVFVHDDPSRDMIISDEKIKELAGEDVHIIRNDITENIFYYGKLFENAKQIHCMESCFRSLVETWDIRGKLYFHNLRTGASGFLGNSTRQPWEEIKY